GPRLDPSSVLEQQRLVCHELAEEHSVDLPLVPRELRDHGRWIRKPCLGIGAATAGAFAGRRRTLVTGGHRRGLDRGVRAVVEVELALADRGVPGAVSDGVAVRLVLLLA